MSSNPNLTATIILQFSDLCNLWDWYLLELNPSIEPVDELLEWRLYPFNPIKLSSHPLLSFDLVLKFTGPKCKYNWSWPNLSENSAITLEMILAHPKSQILAWTREICSNPNLTETDIRNRLPKNSWHPSSLAQNINLSPTFILAATSEVDTAAKTKQSFWSWLSKNPNLTAEFVATNVDDDEKWSWTEISHNKFDFCPNSLAQKQAGEHEKLDLETWRTLTAAQVCPLIAPLAQLSLQYFSPYF